MPPPEPRAGQPSQIVVTGVTHDSRAVQPGDVYAALSGARSFQKPWEELRYQILLGGVQFASEVKNHFRKRGPAGGLERWSREPVGLEEVIAAVEKVRGEQWEQFIDRHGDGGRDLVLYLARKTTGLTVSALAKKTGLRQGANVSISVKRYQRRIDEHEEERRIASRVAQMLFVSL